LVPPDTVSCGTSGGYNDMIKYCVIVFIGVPHNEAYRAFKSTQRVYSTLDIKDLITVKVKTGLVTEGSERIAFAIVPDEVHYPDRVVGMALLLCSMQ
jgi:hypothetical protein